MRSFSINIMRLINALASNRWITINDEEKVKKFISKFDKYEHASTYWGKDIDEVQLLPDYNTKKKAIKGEKR